MVVVVVDLVRQGQLPPVQERLQARQGMVAKDYSLRLLVSMVKMDTSLAAGVVGRHSQTTQIAPTGLAASEVAAAAARAHLRLEMVEMEQRIQEEAVAALPETPPPSQQAATVAPA